jgi:hypothetical protein
MASRTDSGTVYHSNGSTLYCATYKQRHSVLCHFQMAALRVVLRTDIDTNVLCHLKTAAPCVVSRTNRGTMCCVMYERPHSSDMAAKVGWVQKLLSFCLGIQIECHATASQPSKVCIWNDSVQRKHCLQHSFSLLPWWIECYFSAVSPLFLLF